jgi:multicomponent Na+:H+ antiporter subunit G
MQEAIKILTIVLGPVVVYWTAAGIVHTPELILRMSSTAKAAVTGIGALLVAMAIYFNNPGGTSGTLAMVGFMLLIAPMAAYAISRTIDLVSVPLSSETNGGELRPHHGPHTHGIGRKSF